VKSLTLYEYEARMYAFQLARVDKEHEMHKQAWLNYQVTSMKESGQKQVPVYKTFNDFYDYEKQISAVTGESIEIDERKKRLANIAKRLNERG